MRDDGADEVTRRAPSDEHRGHPVRELERDVVRRDRPSRASSGRCGGWAHSQARECERRRGRVGVEQTRGQRDVAEARRHIDVRGGPALEQTATDVRAIDERVLRRRRFVVDAARIDVRPVVQQVVGNRDGPGFVQRLLAIASARVEQGP